MRALLDVNVLIALHDAQHVHHGLATDWFEANADADADAGWASCPLTQNGCLRIMSQPAYPNAQSVDVLLAMLARSCAAPVHEFWPDDISLVDRRRFRADRIHGHRQMTDIYLLGLAVQHGGRLVTFDTRIALSAVHGATPRHLVALVD
jgi:uncharacterized protein